MCLSFFKQNNQNYIHNKTPMIVKIKNLSNNQLPAYQTAGAAGVDLRANLPEAPISLAPLERTLVPTGLYLEIPEGYEAQVRPRSGLATKHGITVINSPGTIDSDYRGEVRVPIVNLSNETFTIAHGERIAQMVFAKYEQVTFQEATALSETERGSAGFGSTGK